MSFLKNYTTCAYGLDTGLPRAVVLQVVAGWGQHGHHPPHAWKQACTWELDSTYEYR
jgi:hypothetical protein